MITTVVTVKSRHAHCRLLGVNSPFGSDRITTVLLSYHIRLVTAVNGLKMEYPIVYAHLQYDEIRP